jgi:hypothetical protein
MYYGVIKRIKVKAKIKNEKAQSNMAWVFECIK